MCPPPALFLPFLVETAILLTAQLALVGI